MEEIKRVLLTKRRILALLLAALLLCGCAEEAPETPTEPQPSESLVWETMPALTYGQMEYEKLEVLPWYSGRTEATSSNMMAETEQGHYFSFSENLLYKDKTNPTGWVPVCNNPNCDHHSERCSSYLGYQHFVIHGGRIYIIQNAVGLPDYYSGDMDLLLMSMDPDGSNRELAYAFERQDPSSTPRTTKADVFPFGFFYTEYVLNTDGTHTRYVYRVGPDGTETVRKDETGDEYIYGYGGINYGFHRLYGDQTVLLGDDDAEDFSLTELCRPVGNELESLNLQPLGLTPYSLRGSYLSGDIIRCYRQNDGYYDINIQTGEEVKVANAQLQDASAFIVLPNCILESTMAWENYEGQGITPAEGEHKLLLFDGETWRNVELPKELRTADAAQCIRVDAVTSDKIIIGSYNIFTLYKTGKNSYYIIDLNKEELKMEYVYDL